jgi:2-hydroxychromene-2-carboxylate isomerase
MRVDAYLGLGSRYSYLAFTQLGRIAAETGCRFELIPISSAELMALRPASPFAGAPVSGQYDWDYRRRDAELWAEHYGVPFVEPRKLPDDHRLLARACRAAERQGDLASYMGRLFRAIFAENRAVDRDVCASVAASPDRLLADLDDAAIGARVTADAEVAFRRGAFGVPTFFAGNRMYWGSDRLVLLEGWLRKSQTER